MTGFDVASIREEFPILEREVHGVPLVYLDNAASSQKPRCVIDAVSHYYENTHSNIHRAVYKLAEEATEAYEGARGDVARLLNAPSPDEIVWVRGTTEAINLVAQACVRPGLREGDEILISHLEHHSNIVPWQILCRQTGAVLRVAPIDDRGEVPLEDFAKLLGPRTRMVALAHISNSLGTVLPVEEMIGLAHEHGAKVLLDGAQAVPHQRVDVQALGADFYAFSGHKAYGPTGIGALWGRSEHLEAMEPYQAGGEMILSVSFEKTVYNKVPHKFEAGTPHIAGAVGMGVAARWLMDRDWAALARHEDALLDRATRGVATIEGLRVIGSARHKAAVLSFVLEDVHAHDVGTIVDREGVAVRTGHHCAQPVMDWFGVPATTRASFAAYNTLEEVDRLVAALERVVEIFRA
jgi:cysteine desulfurase/selenocysteine lyase